MSVSGTDRLPVIDLFSGCGGLSEGFEAFETEEGSRPFKLELALDSDPTAIESMELRCFFHSFFPDRVPDEYYDFIQGKCDREELFGAFPEQAEAAKSRSLIWKLREGTRATKKYPEKTLDDKIKKAIGGGKNWVLLGGPPCQAYSVIGRSRNKKKSNRQRGKDTRNFLYKQYLRVLEQHWPAVFLMENVRGVQSHKVKVAGTKMWEKMLEDLGDPGRAFPRKKSPKQPYDGYKLYSLVEHADEHDDFGRPVFESTGFVVRCEKYGIPQTRHRVIILGVRSDIEQEPGILQCCDPVTAGEVLRGLPSLRSGITGHKDSTQQWVDILLESPQQDWWKEAKEKTPEVVCEMDKALRRIERSELKRGGNFVRREIKVDYRPDWFLDDLLGGACNHQTRAHMETDLYRYLFVSCYVKIKETPVRLNNFPEKLLPKHKNAKTLNFTDRFAAVARKLPSKTVTGHMEKDGHYYVHYDAEQCRSLTVREAARLQTFPDNYYFCGARGRQYRQIGNAVPPLISYQIAKIVADLEIGNG